MTLYIKVLKFKSSNSSNVFNPDTNIYINIIKPLVIKLTLYLMDQLIILLYMHTLITLGSILYIMSILIKIKLNVQT